MTWLRSFLFNAINYPLQALLVIILGPFALFVGKKACYWVLWCMGCLYITLARFICGVRYCVEGVENLPSSSFILASKHQSAWETGAYLVIFPRALFVLKKELFSIPIYGALLKKVGMIPIDRKQGKKALKDMIEAAQNETLKHAPIIIFPEGTRQAPGIQGKYQSGAYLLQKKTKRVVVPVAINSGVFWPRRTFKKYPGTITVKILPPMPVYEDRHMFMEHLSQSIEEHSNALCGALLKK
jgi:1-acyl-sn-glycerol-3-phosphate acyltransferase